jgi:malonyl-CoA decarboxylase
MDLQQAKGLLVNYLYAFDEIGRDHRAFTRKGLVAHSPHSLAG